MKRCDGNFCDFGNLVNVILYYFSYYFHYQLDAINFNFLNACMFLNVDVLCDFIL